MGLLHSSFGGAAALLCGAVGGKFSSTPVHVTGFGSELVVRTGTARGSVGDKACPDQINSEGCLSRAWPALCEQPSLDRVNVVAFGFVSTLPVSASSGQQRHGSAC